jgi:universal stress protein A
MNTMYQHILIATDFSKHCSAVAHKGRQLAQCFDAQLSIIHVVDNLPISDAAYGPIIPFDGDLTEEIMMTSRQRLQKLAAEVQISEDLQWLEIGSPKIEIIRIADEQAVDLIVVGSHGRHGLELLLGSTANGVLHRAHCDVLAVRLQDS